jgi:hypothetical protein
MDSWNAQRQLAASRIAQIEDRIALQRQRVERLHLQDDDASLPIRLISVLQESLARAKEHAQYVEQRIAVHKADSGRRRTLAALINVAQIECKIADLDRQAKAIENAIQTEEIRTGVHDPAHFAYPSAAKGMIERRDKMIRLIEALKRQLNDAKGAIDRALLAHPQISIRRPPPLRYERLPHRMHAYPIKPAPFWRTWKQTQQQPRRAPAIRKTPRPPRA